MLRSSVVLLFGLTVCGQEPIRVPRLDLELTLPELERFARQKEHESDRRAGYWSRGDGGNRVDLSLFYYPPGFYYGVEPDTIAHHRAGDLAPKWQLVEREFESGPFGPQPYGIRMTFERKAGAGKTWMFLARLPDHAAYEFQATAYGEAPADFATAMDNFLPGGIRYLGEVSDGSWTDEEIRQRWLEFTPEDLHEKLRDPIITDHYVILSNASAGKLFAKKMETFYREVQKTYPFPEIEGRRKMPVFLFRSRDQYKTWSKHALGAGSPVATRSKGHAFKDYYATYYDSPNDPVHIHEATHQIFSNRLGLDGGGSWFQEGVAEYMSTSARERRAWARNAARRGEQMQFETFVRVPSLMSGPSMQTSYAQAASMIELLRDSKQFAPRFPDFLARVGAAPRSDLEAIQTIVRDLYDTDLAGLEKAWVEYWRR